MLQFIIVLIVVGVLLWLVQQYIPMAQPIKTILSVVVVIAVILYTLSFFGVLSGANAGSFNSTSPGCSSNVRR